MGLFGDLVTGALGGFPEIPDAPRAPFVDPSQAQLTTANSNLSALGTLQDVGENVNSYNLQQRAKQLGSIPGFEDLSQQGSNVLGSGLRGELNPDVAAAVSRRANSRAFAGGYGGTPAADNLDLRDFGLTSMDVQNRALASAPSWLQSQYGMRVPAQYDVTSGFLSPGQTISANQWNETNRYNQEWLQNQLNSIPDPETAAIARGVGGLTDTVATAALAWAGGAIGGLGGAGGGVLGGQIGGAIGGGGGLGGAASQMGGTIGGLNTQTLPTWATSPYGANPYSYLQTGQQGGWAPSPLFNESTSAYANPSMMHL